MCRHRVYVVYNVHYNFTARDLVIEKEARSKAESKAADLERQLSVVHLDLKNEKQKLCRIEDEYTSSQKKVSTIYVKYW